MLPDGKNSVEICQKLIDGKYISDPVIFYVPTKGKTKPVAGQPLKPQNVCWDFTERQNGTGLDTSDSDFIPTVFLTGYRLNYVAGGSAVPETKPYPVFWYAPDTWWPSRASDPPGLAVAYKNNGSRFILLNDDGLVPGVIREDFNARGRIYRQLTPDGGLP